LKSPALAIPEILHGVAIKNNILEKKAEIQPWQHGSQGFETNFQTFYVFLQHILQILFK